MNSSLRYFSSYKKYSLISKNILIYYSSSSSLSLSSSPSSPSLDLNNSLIITNSCSKRINDLKNLSNDNSLSLRVLVEGGGCSGFQYIFKMDNKLEEDDLVFTKNNSSVVVDPASFDLIRGSTIDYQQELIRSAFTVINNPQSESACGCGSSFAVKAFSQNPAKD